MNKAWKCLQKVCLVCCMVLCFFSSYKIVTNASSISLDIVIVNDTKKGNAMEQIAVRNYLYEYTYVNGETEMSGKTNTNYEAGDEYIFILQHIQNVYEDMYIILSDYIESDQVNVIVMESTYIAKVEIQELYRSTEVVDVYACNITELIKGDMTTTIDNQILIPFFKDTVEAGESYIVCLSSDNDDSIIYTLSSPNSVLTVNQLESIKNIMDR